MRYTFRQLEYFVAAGESGSITVASGRIFISQTAISNAIAHLELELGVKLFHRHHAQGLTLTPVGRTMLVEAKALLEKGEALHRLVEQASHGHVINIGCFQTLAPLVMPELTEGFSTLHPDAELKVSELHQEQIFEALRRRDIDVAVTFGLQIPDDIAFQPLANLPLQVWMAENDRLVHQPAVELKELAPHCLVLLDLPISREYTLDLFRNEGLMPRTTRRSTNIELIRTLVANGCGYFVAGAHPRSDFALDGRRVIRRRLSGNHQGQRLGLATLAGAGQSGLARAFERHCGATISDFYIPGMAAPAMEHRASTAAMPDGAEIAAAY